MSKLNTMIICACVMTIAAGQILFKYSAGMLNFSTERNFVHQVGINSKPLFLILIALSLYAISTIGWIYCLRSVPLSIAFMFNALSFVVVPLAGVVLFGETISKSFMIGTIAILGGIVLTFRG